MPIVSVLVPVFNQTDCLGRTLKSILTQDCDLGQVELIISDDGSKDHIREFIEFWLVTKEIDNLNALKITLHKNNLGREGQNNSKYLFSQVSPESKYVCHLEAGDEWLPTKLSKNIEFLESHPDYVAVHSNFIGKYPGGFESQDEWNGWGDRNNEQLYTYSNLLQGNRILTCCLTSRTDAYRKAEDRDLFEKHDILLADYAITLRLARQGKIGYINEILAKYDVDPNSSTHDPFRRGKVVFETGKLQQLAWQGII